MVLSPTRLLPAALLAAAFLLPAGTASAAGGQNEYGGYDIAGVPGMVERPYGETRGWQVVSATLKGKFAYCAGTFDDNGTPWRLGTDGGQWQLALPMTARPDWQGYLGLDGDSRSTSGSAGHGWTFVWLQLPERDRIGTGSDMTIEVGSTTVHHALIGTAAVITKIEECMSRKGQPPKSAAAPAPAATTATATATAPAAPRNSGPCPDDGPRLPVTGLCRGRATAYLNVPSQPDLFIFPDKACSWDLQETALPDNSVLLYRVLRCKGVTSHLEFAGGAHYAQLIPDRSAIDAAYGGKGKVADAKPLAWIKTIDPANVRRDLTRASAEGLGAAAKKYKCRLTPSKLYDGYVFGADPSTLPDEPTPAVCGTFSEGDGVMRFWRVFGDTAILFDMPGEAYQEFDPVSMVRLARDSAGNWAVVP